MHCVSQGLPLTCLSLWHIPHLALSQAPTHACCCLTSDQTAPLKSEQWQIASLWASDRPSAMHKDHIYTPRLTNRHAYTRTHSVWPSSDWSGGIWLFGWKWGETDSKRQILTSNGETLKDVGTPIGDITQRHTPSHTHAQHSQTHNSTLTCSYV